MDQKVITDASMAASESFDSILNLILCLTHLYMYLGHFVREKVELLKFQTFLWAFR